LVVQSAFVHAAPHAAAANFASTSFSSKMSAQCDRFGRTSDIGLSTAHVADVPTDDLGLVFDLIPSAEDAAAPAAVHQSLRGPY